MQQRPRVWQRLAIQKNIALCIFCVVFAPALAYAGGTCFYSQGGYYSQGSYYTQGSYYSQGEYYSESGYYSQGEYYSEGGYYTQASYEGVSIPTGTFTFEYEPNGRCAVVTVTKRDTPPYTTIHADGYSVSCTERASNPRTLQRSVELNY